MEFVRGEQTKMRKTKHVEIRPEGIYLIKEKELTLGSFRANRTRLENQIMEIQNSQRHHERELKNNAILLQSLEHQLLTFNSPEAMEWERFMEQKLADEREKKKQEKQEANNKAKQLLHEYLGDESYKVLMKKGRINFTGNDGRTYQVTKKGELLRDSKRLCMIHPRNLPLPDFIIAIMTTVKEVGRRA